MNRASPQAQRVVHVAASLRRGGTEVACLALSREFKSRGIENHAYIVERGDTPLLEDYNLSFETVTRSTPGRFLRAIEFCRYCFRMRPALIIMHLFNIEHVVLAIAARIAGVNTIIVKQGNPVLSKSRDKSAAKLSIVLGATRLLRLRLVCSSAWIKQSMASLGALPRVTKVVHNGCDVREISARAQVVRDGREHSSIRIGMIARFDPIKDHVTLIEAMRLLPAEINGVKVELLLVGAGPSKASIEEMVKDFSLGDRVHFLGGRGNIAEFLGGLDLFVFSTTRDEGFGIVLIEALAAETPIVASDVPACREVLLDGGIGCLVAPGDAKELSEAIWNSLTGAAHGSDLDEIRSLYDTATMADGYLSIA